MNSRRNGNMHWTHAEDIMMAEAYECGMSDKELGELLGRSDKSISVRRTKLANRKLKSYSRKAYKILTDTRNERREAYCRGETPVIKATGRLSVKHRPISAAQSGRVLAVREAERNAPKKQEDRPIEVYSKLPMKTESPAEYYKLDWIAYASGFASGAGLLAVIVMTLEVLS